MTIPLFTSVTPLLKYMTLEPGIFSVPFEAHANKHWNVVQHKDSIGHVPLVGPRGAVCFSKSGGEGAGSLFL